MTTTGLERLTYHDSQRHRQLQSQKDLKMDLSAQEWTDSAWAKRHDIIYLAQMNRLYHQKRERFFAILDRSSKALALIAGTSAASALIPTPEAKAFLGLTVAAVTLPNLVFGWSDKARLHAELSADYVKIEADLIAAGILSLQELNEFEAKAVRIGVKEPAALSALVRMCQNELAVSVDSKAHIFPLKWYEKLLVHVFDMPKQDIPVKIQ